MRAPSFWYKPAGPIAALLSPFGSIYRAAGIIRRAATTPYAAKIPVICVGNIVAGGAGKTPAALALAELLTQNGAKPVFVTRGYGGCEYGPLQVDPARHGARDVGDEALLLARAAPVWTGRDRAKAVQAAEPHATHIILDDGLQNPAIKPSTAFLVIDGERGFGNGCLIPAGPLRETLDDALPRIQAIILIGEQKEIPFSVEKINLPILHARLRPDLPSGFPKAQTFFAFAGIGRPEKFYRSCRDAGLTLAATRDFPDHHPFTARDLAQLKEQAAQHDARLLTTEKDWMRLPDDWRDKVTAFPVKLAFDDDQALMRLLNLR